MWKRVFIKVLVLLLIVVISMLLTRWWFGVVVNSNMPDWLKYVILKG